MDSSIKAISGRRRSTIISPEASGASPPSSSSPASLITPRKASVWDSPAAPPSDGPTASAISARRATATTADDPPENSGSINSAGWKVSAWTGQVEMLVSSPEEDPSLQPPGDGGGAGVSASNIAGRRATEMDRPPWDVFAGAPPDYVGSTWAWISEIAAMTSAVNSGTPAAGSLVSEKNRVFYAGNIEYIFSTYKDQSLGNDDLEAIMYSYGIDETSAGHILNKVDPQKRGIFNLNAHNKQIPLTTNMDFSYSKELLSNLRQASKCLEKNLLSPLHFAAYILHILKGRYIGNEPRFMILGLYSILGVLERSANGLLITKDVETFMGLWRVLNLDEARDFIDFINEEFNGEISCFDMYNLLYRRNLFGKQRIQMFDIKGLKDPSLFFPLMDKDDDGYLSAIDLQSFAAIFDRYPSDEAINNATRKLDLDGDGKINREDFRQAMVPILDGITWEFWLVAILYVLEL